ncbi:MAG TPA: metalloregulator ArsR/SmtB family transcription factor [Terriglobales bacterium]|nr:metalloregulator ArsR/SmtB family transcription factor [Terriglobales bacterium]
MQKQVEVFKALGDETRLRILKLLLKRELCVCELETALDLSQSKVSRHLTILRSLSLVVDRREGVWIFYSLFKPQDDFEKSVIQIIENSLSGSELVKQDEKRLMKKLSQVYAYKCK